MTEHHVFDVALRGLGFIALALSLSMIMFWGPSFLRTFRGRGTGRDGARAIWVSMAIAVLLYQMKWATPGISDINRLQIWVVAKAAMVGALLGAIYHHGRDDRDFDPRKAILIHLAMLGLAILFAAVVG